MTQKEIEYKVVSRAWQDESFKRALLRNPKSALAKEGINIPDNIEITVFEETPTCLALVLPVNSNARELSEADLETVSGGAAAAQGLDIGWD